MIKADLTMSLEEVIKEKLCTIKSDDRYIGIGWENPITNTINIITFDDIVRAWRLKDYLNKNLEKKSEMKMIRTILIVGM